MTDVVCFEIDGLNRRRTPVAYKLDSKVNIFFGPNGSGKTSILKILHSALSGEAGSISNVAFDKASVKIHSIRHRKDFLLRYSKPTESVASNVLESPTSELSVELVRSVSRRLSREKNKEPGWQSTPEAPDGFSGRWAHTYLPTSRLYMDSRTDPAMAIYLQRSMGGVDTGVEDTLDNDFARSLQSLWSTRYGTILGRVGSIQQEALRSIFLDVLMPDVAADTQRKKERQGSSNLDAGRAFERMSSFLKRQSNHRIQQALGSKDEFARRYNSDIKLKQIVNRIDVVEAQIEREMKPIAQLSELVQRLFLKGKSVSFDGPRISVQSDTGGTIGLERLSSGEKHLLRILVAALDASESSLLIDEPELSMHIDWQRELVKDIHSLNPDCQLILATHSPEVMADIPDEKIFRV